jgi:hypothetical protein
VIPVPASPNAPAPQNFPPDPVGSKRAWPERLAVSADGSTLLAALGLSDAAAVIDVASGKLRYVDTGSYPYGAAILPDGKTGLISNRGPGTVSVIDLAAATKVKDIAAGAHLSHPESITLAPDGSHAYVPLANADAVAVIDTARLELERTLSTARAEGAGTAPVDTAVSADGRYLLVAESAANEVAVFALPQPSGSSAAGAPYALLGRLPTAAYPTAVDSVPASAGLVCDNGAAASHGPAAQHRNARAPRHRRRHHAKRRALHPRRHAARHRHRHRNSHGITRPVGNPSPADAACAKLVWVAAKGFGLGPNADPSLHLQGSDVPTLLTTKAKVTGFVGVADLPSLTQIGPLTRAATAQLHPADDQAAPPDTPLRAGGPIKHVFYIVKENRTYDQVLGDDPRGAGDPRYAIFGRNVTPNTHALAERFPLLDRFYANSEASIDGHYWTAAANVSDYVHKTWRQNYAGRGYPVDAWFYQIAYPQTGLLFDRADQQGVSWINLGEGVAHLSSLPDKDRNLADLNGVLRRYSKSDLGVLTPGGCYDPFIGTDDIANAANVPIRLYDSSKPAGAPEPSLSRFDCFRTHFAQWDTLDNLPSLVYMTVPNDHTNGTSPGHHTPRAMVADNDRGVGQIVDLISHSRFWRSSAIFVVEDDSQDGVDHVDAHRIPALVISPYARRGGILHGRYDMPSVVRSVELILGLKPMNLFDATARPLYDAFSASPANAEPFSALAPTYPLLEENPAHPTSAAARRAARYRVNLPDRIPQRLLDRVLWKSVNGPASEPPPPGPNAQGG